MNSPFKYYESYTKSYKYTFWYNFDKVLYQFLETGTSDKCLKCLNQLLRFSGFSLPLSFFLYSPLIKSIFFKKKICSNSYCGTKKIWHFKYLFLCLKVLIGRNSQRFIMKSQWYPLKLRLFKNAWYLLYLVSQIHYFQSWYTDCRRISASETKE